jgi:hypothetical protein
MELTKKDDYGGRQLARSSKKEQESNPEYKQENDKYRHRNLSLAPGLAKLSVAESGDGYRPLQAQVEAKAQPGQAAKDNDTSQAPNPYAENHRASA